MSHDPNPNGTGAPTPESSPAKGGGRPLPPPAFPPGMRRAAPRKAPRAGDDLTGAFISPDEPLPDRTGDVPDDAFISPDEPITRGGRSQDGFISPDEPLPRRTPRAATAVEEDFDPDEVVVTGIGDDPHLSPDELALGFDPHVHELVEKVGKLAEALKRKGEAGLKSTPGMSRFEATLRSYCVGYLAGRRAEEEEGGGPPTAM